MVKGPFLRARWTVYEVLGLSSEMVYELILSPTSMLPNSMGAELSVESTLMGRRL